MPSPSSPDRQFDRYTFSYTEEHPDEVESIKQEHLARLAQGMDAWNAWATAFAAYIENTDEASQKDFWIDLSSMSIEVSNFRGYVFPCAISFSGTEFSGNAYFIDAQFSGNASFSDAQFSGNADFQQVKFDSNARFDDAIFLQQARFDSSLCAQSMVFEGAQFKAVPDMRYTHWAHPPYLSNVGIPSPDQALASDGRGFEQVQRYRKLKELAISAKDHQKELEFFAYETRAARGVESKGLRNLPGHLYQALSNFGQSISRPLVFLLAVIGVSFMVNMIALHHSGLLKSFPTQPAAESNSALPITKSNRTHGGSSTCSLRPSFLMHWKPAYPTTENACFRPPKP